MRSPATIKHSDGRFPATRWSLVLDVQAEDERARERALSELCEMYWYPLYALARRSGKSAPDAEDLTQGFIARLLEREHLNNVSAGRGKLRSYLLRGMKNFMVGEWQQQTAQKRGGADAVHFSIDASEAEARYRHEPVDPTTPETLFERRWALVLLERAGSRLEEEFEKSDRAETFAVLKEYLVKGDGGEKYQALAERLDMTAGAIKVTVHRMRKRLRALLEEEIAHTVADPAEIDAEVAHLFRVFA